MTKHWQMQQKRNALKKKRLKQKALQKKKLRQTKQLQNWQKKTGFAKEAEVKLLQNKYDNAIAKGDSA